MFLSDIIMCAISEDTLLIFHNKMLACHLQSANMHIMFSYLLAAFFKYYNRIIYKIYNL